MAEGPAMTAQRAANGPYREVGGCPRECPKYFARGDRAEARVGELTAVSRDLEMLLESADA